MIMNFWKTYILVTTLIVLTVGGSEDDPELKERVVKVKAAMCASPLPADKIDRLFECDMLVSLAGKETFNLCHMESLGIKSMEEGVRKMCAFKGEDYKDYHHKVMRCVLEKGKDIAAVKEWEEKKKNNREDYKKEKKEMMTKSMVCKEQVLGI